VKTPSPLAFEADPEDKKLALLLVHGLLSSSLQWLPNAALSQQFRLIRVDLPGHGASVPPARPEDARPEALVAGLDLLRRELAIARWHVCGASFGAGIALRYALDHPDTCLTVSFTNGNAALREVWSDEDLRAQAALAARIRAGGAEAVRAMPYHPAHARRFAPEFRVALAEEADRATAETVALYQQEAIPRLSVRHRLGQLQCPCLLINGAMERRFQPSRNWLALAHPQITIADLLGGHSINVECSQAFNAVLGGFILESGI